MSGRHSIQVEKLLWRVRIAFTANSKLEIRVYIFVEKISTQMKIVQNNSDL